MGYSIIKADIAEDEHRIKRFWLDNFEGWPEGKYDVFYRDNPFGQALCWLIQDDDTGTAIGASAAFPKKMRLNSQDITAGIAGDLAVLKEHRKLGAATDIQKVLVDKYRELGLDFLYATPNIISEKVALKSGYKLVGRTVRLIKILKSYYLLKRYLKIGILARIAAFFVDLFFTLKSPESQYINTGKYRFEIVKKYDKRFDELWQRAFGQYKLVGERSSVALNWRFGDCPYKDYYAFALIDKQTNTIEGYIVYQIVKKNVQVVDCFANDLEHTLDPLLSEFIHYFRKQAVNTITFYYFGNSRVVDKVKAYDFITRPDNRSIVVEISKDLPYHSLVMEKENWHYLDGDNDGDE